MAESTSKLTIFRPPCPRCEAQEAYLDPDVPSNGWRHTCMMLGLLFGAGSLTMYLICGACGEKYKSVKNNAYPR